MHSVIPAIRPFVDGPQGTFLEVACRQCWWNLGFSIIEQYATKLMADYAPGPKTLFDLLWQTVQKVLKLSDDDTLSIVHRRVAKQEPREASTALLQVDEALEVLEETDVRLVKDERSAFLAKQAEHDEFALSYQRKAESERR